MKNPSIILVVLKSKNTKMSIQSTTPQEEIKYTSFDYRNFAKVMKDTKCCPHIKSDVFDDVYEKTNGFLEFPKDSIRNLATIYIEGLDAKERIKEITKKRLQARTSFLKTLFLSQYLIVHGALYCYFFTKYPVSYGVIAGIAAFTAVKVSVAAIKALYNLCIRC